MLGGPKPALQPANGRSYSNGETARAQVVAMLMTGPKTIGELGAAIGGAKSRVYGTVNYLLKKKLAKSAGKGVWQVTDKAMAEVNPQQPHVPALPAPAVVKRGPAGRAAPGSGNIVLRAALEAGPVRPSDLRARMASKGMSPKSISGVLERAKRDGLVKKNGSGYALTAKGQKIEQPAMEAAHG
ncbi:MULTISPECIES: helix-turn-helix domain-containing protein [Bradyrhizobium]|uniref:hypothetical protein n=1 Tax=Bradyrhizobium TaxID=374 RepID=UPI001BABC133|nr:MULTISPECIES: hypothetical protein [Bradyrhizobium]MBR0879601.1 hypothetical protein [Bradyrhizobium liaoningense]MCP1778847.1 putative transcriptional regulator [Bradyrhizobium japonicum]MCP1958155.1 putative transcriptional regulator [Bradyrhizobium japonicum]